MSLLKPLWEPKTVVFMQLQDIHKFPTSLSLLLVILIDSFFSLRLASLALIILTSVI